MKVYRQGDVLVRQVGRRKPGGKDVSEEGRIILAHGEVTGHVHEVVAAGGASEYAPDALFRPSQIETDLPPAQFFEEPDGRRFLFVNAACALVHQEHGRIALTPGCYQVVRQREYSPGALRNVAD